MKSNTLHGLEKDLAVKLAHSVLTDAFRKPWLLRLLRLRCDWVERLIHQVSAFQRNIRRFLFRKLAAGSAITALMLTLAGPSFPVHAATITVDGITCTLQQAIDTAKDGSVQGSCVTGNASGPDTIILNTDVSLPLNGQIKVFGHEVTIEGNHHTVDGNNISFLFHVATGGILTINEMNLVNGKSVNGGAIWNDATLYIHNSTLSNNHATGSGGAIVNFSNLTIENSTLSGNTTPVKGGAIYDLNSMTIKNSTISGNQSGTGGGAIYTISSTFNINNSTITNNTSTGAGSAGGAILSAGNGHVENTIIAENIAGAAANDCNTAIGNFGYNIESGTGCGFSGTGSQQNVSSGNLNLLALDNNGTLPHPDTHALGAGSVAIDRIPIGTNGCGTTIISDERGSVRAGQVTPGDHRGGTSCDVGAYEYDSTQAPTSLQVKGFQAHSGISVLVSSALAALGGVFAWLRLRR